MLLLNMDVLDLSYKVKYNQVFRSYMQGSSLERNIAGIQYGMNEIQRWLLANAMAHKKANKRCSIVTINLCRTNKHYGRPLR